MKEPNYRLRELLAESGWSGEALARAVNLLGAQCNLPLHYDRTSVAHWLAGSHPQSRVVPVIVEVLSRRLGRPLGLPDAGFSALHCPPALGSAASTALRELAALGAAEADPGRRSELDAMVYSLHALHDVLDPDRGQESSKDSSHEVTDSKGRACEVVATQKDWEWEQRGMAEAASLFARNADTFGGGYVKAPLAAYMARASSTLQEADKQRLMTTQVVLLSHVLAQAHAECGEHGLALAYYRLALCLADENADPLGGALTLRGIAVQALELGHPHEAVRLCGAAARRAPRGDIGLEVHIAGPYAAALAAAGHRDAALRVQELKGKTLTRPMAWGLAPVAGQPLALWYYYTALAHHALGDRPTSVSRLRHCLDNLEPYRQCSCAVVHGRLALELLTLGRLAEATHHGHLLCDLYPRLQSARVHDLLARLHAEPRIHQRDSEAQRLCARMAALLRQPLTWYR
ncbi:hypothetical protein AB0D11_41535 [Streptomyces monashensis]|uniref:hypothetical protein n=1 Tax=Streptomyces monashensis TaxID=1678012 RepID=UPI0033D17B86